MKKDLKVLYVSYERLIGNQLIEEHHELLLDGDIAAELRRHIQAAGGDISVSDTQPPWNFI